MPSQIANRRRRVRVAAGGFNLVLETRCIFTSNLIASRAFGNQLSRFRRLRRSFGMPNEQVAVCVSYHKIQNKIKRMRNKKQTVNNFFGNFLTHSNIFRIIVCLCLSCIVRKWYVKNANYQHCLACIVCVCVVYRYHESVDGSALVTVLIVFMYVVSHENATTSFNNRIDGI